MQKIELSGLKDSDRLVFVGDYVDRGPDTPGVIEVLIGLGKSRPNTVFLRGNHDQAMLDARDILDPDRTSKRKLDDVLWWFSYGGRETIDSYNPCKNSGSWYRHIPESHWEFLESTELEFRESNYIFVHAGLVPPGLKWAEPEDPRMWIREPFIGSMADFGGVVIFGHTPQDLLMPCVMSNKVGIDTGAAYGGPLTAVVVDPGTPYDPDEVRFLSAS